MKVLLISPNIKGFVNGVNRIQPPLGISYLASYLKENHDIMVYDTAIENYSNRKSINKKLEIIGENEENITKKIQSFDPDVVGISILFSNLFDSAKCIAQIVKNLNPYTKVVVGGNHITNCINDYKLGINNIDKIYDENIDFYMIGESEETFGLFLKNFNKDTPD